MGRGVDKRQHSTASQSGTFQGEPDDHLHGYNSLGQTVDKAITMFLKKSQSHHLSPSHSRYSSWLVFHGGCGERTTAL